MLLQRQTLKVGYLLRAPLSPRRLYNLPIRKWDIALVMCNVSVYRLVHTHPCLVPCPCRVRIRALSRIRAVYTFVHNPISVPYPHSCIVPCPCHIHIRAMFHVRPVSTFVHCSMYMTCIRVMIQVHVVSTFVHYPAPVPCTHSCIIPYPCRVHILALSSCPCQDVAGS